jgi:large subunit ribosomal protein L9
MKVILLKDVPKIGKKDEIKDVSDGFAQNALLPKKLAKIATPQAIEALNLQKEILQKAQNAKVEAFKKQIDQLKNSKLIIEQAINTQGHLFSKFKVEQLKKVLKEKSIDFDIKYIVPFEFKEVGVFSIKVKMENFLDTFDIEIKGIK